MKAICVKTTGKELDKKKRKWNAVAGSYSNIPKQICRDTPYVPSSYGYSSLQPAFSFEPRTCHCKFKCSQEWRNRQREREQKEQQQKSSSWLLWKRTTTSADDDCWQRHGGRWRMPEGSAPGVGLTFRAWSNDCDGHKSQRLMKNACYSAASYVLWLVESHRLSSPLICCPLL